MKKFLWSVLEWVHCWSCSSGLHGDDGFSAVHRDCGKNVNIVAPTEPMSKTYTVADLDADAAEATADVDDYDFPAQAWTVKGNVKNGVKVDFVMAPFANLDYPQSHRRLGTKSTTMRNWWSPRPLSGDRLRGPLAPLGSAPITPAQIPSW